MQEAGMHVLFGGQPAPPCTAALSSLQPRVPSPTRADRLAAAQLQRLLDGGLHGVRGVDGAAHGRRQRRLQLVPVGQALRVGETLRQHIGQQQQVPAA